MFLSASKKFLVTASLVMLLNGTSAFAGSWNDSAFVTDYQECTNTSDVLTGQQSDLVYIHIFNKCMEGKGHDMSSDVMLGTQYPTQG